MSLPTRSVIRFGDFSLSPDHYQLTYQGQPVTVGNKGMAILQSLIQAEGTVVSRDELVTQVWPGQIVTDAAVNKQVARLREALAAFTDQPVLETVRGVGFRLVVPIEYASDAPADQPSTTPSRRKPLRLIAALSVSALVIGLLLVFLHMRAPDSADAGAFDAPQRIAVMIHPNVKTPTTATDTALEIMATRIDRMDGLSSTRPSASAAPAVSTESELATAFAAWDLDGLLLIDSQSPAYSLRQASWVDRDADGNLRQETLEAANLTQLIDTTLSHIAVRMGTHTGIETDNSAASITATAEALNLKLEGQLSSAIDRLETRLEQSENDCHAQLQLLDFWLQDGQARQALDASKAWAAFDATSSNCRILLEQRTVLAHVDLEDYPAATEAVAQLEAIAIKRRDPLMMRAVWQIRAYGYEQAGVVAEGLSALREQLALSETVLNDWQESARLHQTLGRHHLALGHFLQASDHLSKAWTLYEQHQDHEGMLTVVSLQIQQATDQAQFNQGLALVERAEPHLEQVTDRVMMDGLVVMARLFIETGRHRQAQQLMKRMESITNRPEARQPEAQLMTARTLQTRAYLNLAQGNYSQALVEIESIKALLSSDDPSLDVLVTPTYLYEVYVYFKQNNLEAFEKRFVDFQETYSEFEQDLEPFQYRLRGFWFALQGQYAEAEKQFSVEIEASLLQGWNNWAIYTCYDLLDVQRRNGYQNFDKTLKQLESIRAVDYPYLKYVAEYQAFLGNHDQAFDLLTELRGSAGDFWTVEDQALLEQYRERTLKP